MTDAEISKKAREAEKRISDIINEFMQQTGIDTFDPSIKFCMDHSVIGEAKTAYFVLNATKRF